jgi:hypothetical protein
MFDDFSKEQQRKIDSGEIEDPEKEQEGGEENPDEEQPETDGKPQRPEDMNMLSEEAIEELKQ